MACGTAVCRSRSSTNLGTCWRAEEHQGTHQCRFGPSAREHKVLGRPRLVIDPKAVWKMPRSGKSIREIREALKLSHGTVQRVIEAHVTKIRNYKCHIPSRPIPEPGWSTARTRHGNRSGRKCGLMAKYGTGERLARIAAGLPADKDGSGPKPSISEQLRAIELQAAYGYGKPTAAVTAAPAGTNQNRGGLCRQAAYRQRRFAWICRS